MGTVGFSSRPEPSHSIAPETQVPERSAPRDDGGQPAPVRPGRLARVVHRCRQSVWLPVVAKASTVLAGMVGLAALGSVSTLSGAGHDVSVERPSARAGAIEPLWIAPVPDPSASAAAAGPQHSDPVSPPKRLEAGEDGGASPTAPPPAGVTADGRVILNTASATELTRLPGVGQKRADAIVALKKRLGRFRKPTDLLRVRGIGVRTLKKMLPHLVVDPPPPKPTADPGAVDDSAGGAASK